RIVHRDLKPNNLFLEHGELDRVKVLDFGLARSTGRTAELTDSGVFMGTLEYMPPEQSIDAKRADARSDVFSFGAVLFHCLVGHPPPGEIVGHAHAIPSVRYFRSGIPHDLAGLVDRMLRLERKERPASGVEVLAGLYDVGADWDAPTVRTNTSEVRALLRSGE